MATLILIGGTSARISGDGEVYVKETFAKYVDGLAQSFSKVIWFLPHAATVNCGAAVSAKNVRIIPYRKSLLPVLLANLKLSYQLLKIHNAFVLLFPSPLLYPVLPLIRHRSRRFLYYLGVDYSEVLGAASLRKIPAWSWIFKKSHEDPMKYADMVIARGKHLYKVASNYNKHVEITMPIGWYKDDSKSESKKSDSLNILFIGKVIREKGVFNLLSAFEELTEKYGQANIHLDIVGDGEGVGKVSSCVDDRSMRNISLHGWVDDGDIIKGLFREASCLVCPTLPGYPEGVPRVIDEAHLYNVPVIASRVGGITEEFNDGSVLLIDGKDDSALVQALEDFLNSQEIRQKLLVKMSEREKNKKYPFAYSQHAAFILGESA